MERPLVSVVMPVLNFERYVGEAVDSILAQSWRDLELILVDDGSSDRTPEILADYARKEARVRTLHLEPDPTLTSSARAANRGIALAKGDFIARMDADDIALPHRIERQVGWMEANGLDVCGGQAMAFGAVDRPYWFPQSEDAILRELIFRVGILHPTMIVRAAQMRSRPYLAGASHEDYEWEIRAAFQCRMGNVPDVVLRHRVHPQQANRRHQALFGRDLRQYRFRHVFRLFPRTRPAEYQILSAIAEHADLDGPDDLETAGAWLARLADHPDPLLRQSMLRRWRRVCDGAGLEAADPLRLRFEDAIVAGAAA